MRLLIALLMLPVMTVAAQPDTLRLGQLRAAAAQQDPRAVQPDLLAQATRLRLAALRAQRLPHLALSGQATVQNDVTEIPFNLPGQDVPALPREQVRAQIEAEWTLYDGGRTGRQAEAERARLTEEVAGVAVTSYALREATTEAYFSVLLAAAQAGALALVADDLEARLRVAHQQAEEGVALRSTAAMLEAELIRTRQQIQEADAARRAASSVLSDLTGIAIDSSAILALPDLDAEVAVALLGVEAAHEYAQVDDLRGRPELLRLKRRAARAEAEAQALGAQTRPVIDLFGQAGVGRPSPFNFFSDALAEYALAGVRLRWSLFDGGRARREADALRVQARLAETEADAFIRQIRRDIEDERVALVRLEQVLVDDEQVVALREEVLRVARRQLEEGVLLPDTYTDRLTDLAEARLTLERHRIERAQAQARLLSTLGRFPEIE